MCQYRWHMATTFAEKFEQALEEKRQTEPGYGLRTLARELAKGDPTKVETIRRRLNKYRPKNGGGAAEVAPTPPTRNEIEGALGLERDALAPERDAPMEEMIAVLMPSAAVRRLIREEMASAA